MKVLVVTISSSSFWKGEEIYRLGSKYEWGTLQVVSYGLGLAGLQDDRLGHLLQKERRDDAKNSNNPVQNLELDIR